MRALPAHAPAAPAVDAQLTVGSVPRARGGVEGVKPCLVIAVDVHLFTVTV